MAPIAPRASYVHILESPRLTQWLHPRAQYHYLTRSFLKLGLSFASSDPEHELSWGLPSGLGEVPSCGASRALGHQDPDFFFF